MEFGDDVREDLVHPAVVRHGAQLTRERALLRQVGHQPFAEDADEALLLGIAPTSAATPWTNASTDSFTRRNKDRYVPKSLAPSTLWRSRASSTSVKNGWLLSPAEDQPWIRKAPPRSSKSSFSRSAETQNAS